MREIKFNFTITGFFVALILVSMFAGVLGMFLADIQTKYNHGGENTFYKYNNSKDILNYSAQIEDSIDIQQDEGLLDVIGGYFRSGYNSLRIAFKSFSLFKTTMDNGSTDFEGLNYFKPYLIAIILISLFIGVVISALLKLRI